MYFVKHALPCKLSCQAAIAHTNVPSKLSKEQVSQMSAIPSYLEGLDPSKSDAKVDLKVSATARKT